MKTENVVPICVYSSEATAWEVPSKNLRMASRVVESTAYQLAGETDAAIISQLIIMAAELDRLQLKLQNLTS